MSLPATQPERMTVDPRRNCAGLLLAGGLGRRMGGGLKGMVLLARRPLLAHVVARASPQVARLAVNANAPAVELAPLGLPVLPDPVAGFAGPLAGVLAGMIWAREAGYGWVASFPCDAPFFPEALVCDLAAEAGRADIVTATSGGRRHPVFALWATSLADDLHHALAEEGLRKVDRWTARHRVADVEFPIPPEGDPFFNINTREDLAAAEARLDSESSGGPAADHNDRPVSEI